MAAALARIETAPAEVETLALLDAAYRHPTAHVIGLTGPPGVGKSTLLARLLDSFRGQRRTVGVLAIDPSSRRSGGALLGDRARLTVDPEDQGVFVRSMAARGWLGGLAALTPAAVVLMRAVYDLVIVETVGVGQSETEVASVADTVLLCIQPGSGDSLQYMKAGIAELPDIAVVSKADLGSLAEKARNDLVSALALDPGRVEDWPVPVLMVSATTGRGLSDLSAALARHAAFLADGGRREGNRQAQAEAWLAAALREEFGRAGLARAARLEGGLHLTPGQSPFHRLHALARTLAD